MTTSMEWSELIELLEKAVGPDQKLDELIERRLHKISGAAGRILLPYGLKPYTSDLAAALSLVPEGCNWAVGTRDKKSWGEAAKKWPLWAECGDVDTCGVNPAIALTLAALKARL
jgi:hypothetical protein